MVTFVEAAPTVLTRSDAVRFLQRATFGGTPADVGHVMSIGINAWLDEQQALTPAQTHHQRRVADVRFNSSIWQSYLSDPDQLRKRVAYAFSQIFVVSDNELSDREVAVFADILEAHSFGNYRDLLEAITRSAAMGNYLTYNRNRRADDRRGTVPDENYAREVMQLFSIGLWELNQDGTRTTDGSGEPIPTYDTNDILGLARVFTGFLAPKINDDPNRYALPMEATGEYAERYHETGAKQFLGTTIPASETRTLDESLAVALDTLANHPNIGPFICHQLIQRLVTSNPSPAYLGRCAAVFADNGSAQRGDLGAVVRAVLTDDEAWPASPAPSFGKLREPTLRFTVLTRALGVAATHLPWILDDLGDQSTELSQQPFDSPSVFNFYRPGYVPPQSALGDAGLAAPEMQLANETTAIGWVNFLARFLRRPPGRTINRNTPQEYRSQIFFDVDDLLALVDSKSVTAAEAGDLVDEIAARLCPAGLSDAVRSIAVRRVVEIYDDRYESERTEDYHVRRRSDVHLDRVMAAAMMVAASTDFLWER